MYQYLTADVHPSATRAAGNLAPLQRQLQSGPISLSCFAGGAEMESTLVVVDISADMTPEVCVGFSHVCTYVVYK